MGQVYAEFQGYVKSLKDIGVMLNVNSKNEEENALAGLNHPDGVVNPDDFIIIKANWEPKSENMLAIAHELNILPDSLVFADDNPAEREIVRVNACLLYTSHCSESGGPGWSALFHRESGLLY